MEKKLLALTVLLFFAGITTCGCVKLNTYTHERVDLEPYGNKGYITGKAAHTASSEKNDRKVLQLEVTLPGTTKESEGTCESEYKPEKTRSPKIK